jgi:hypothetical protein
LLSSSQLRPSPPQLPPQAEVLVQLGTDGPAAVAPSEQVSSFVPQSLSSQQAVPQEVPHVAAIAWVMQRFPPVVG